MVGRLHLGRIWPGGEVRCPGLVKLLNDKVESIRVTAARRLGKIGPEAEAAVPALIERFKEKSGELGLQLRSLGKYRLARRSRTHQSSPERE